MYKKLLDLFLTKRVVKEVLDKAFSDIYSGERYFVCNSLTNQIAGVACLNPFKVAAVHHLRSRIENSLEGCVTVTAWNRHVGEHKISYRETTPDEYELCSVELRASWIEYMLGKVDYADVCKWCRWSFPLTKTILNEGD